MPKSKVERAAKELKGFTKVYLARGNSQDFNIGIEVDKLAFYDESISDWNLETGKYVLYIGNASDNIVKEIKITVE
jgi:beta-glucosidase